MRLPMRRVYRAFPELDRFDDLACQGFIEMVGRKHAASMGMGALAAIAAAVPVSVMGIVVVATLGSMISNGVNKDWLDPMTSVESWTGFGLCVLLVGAVTAGPVVGLIVRDAWLRSLINHHLRDTRCSSCKYSLLGLPVIDGVIVCPECGLGCSLAARGMTEEEFIAQ